VGLELVLDRLAEAPRQVGVFFDLDGTLAQIELNPTEVRPVEGVAERIHELAAHVGVVAIVSGRPVAFLERFFDDPDIELSGLYGLEHRTRERLFVDSEALSWLPVVSRTADAAREAFGTEAVEDKRYSITIHYRSKPDAFAEAVRTWSTDIARDTGLHARDAKMSVELHPPTVGDKGSVVARLVAGHRAAAYFGDDVGDLPAFEELATLTTAGQLDVSARVLVTGPETPSALRPLATDTIDGPMAVVAAIDQMLERLT